LLFIIDKTRNKCKLEFTKYFGDVFMDLQNLFEIQNKLLKKTVYRKKRYLYPIINWDLKSIGILGQRGVGKTTMMLQYIKAHYEKSDKVLYISLDIPFFETISLFEFAQEFEQYGGERLFIDEVHKYQNWSIHIKNIYDNLDLKVVFSGSSILRITQQNADLSRRSLIYQLENLSFREYLSFTDTLDFEKIHLKRIIKDHVEIAGEICSQIKPLKSFRTYLSHGAYPFITEGSDTYHQKITQIVNLILETDLPYINPIHMAQIKKLKKFIYLLAVNVPFIPNITDLANATQISRPKIYEYLNYLEVAKLINSVKSKEKGYKILSKPEKLYMQNTNISYALTSNIDIGAREAFFVNQIKNNDASQQKFLDETIFTSKKGDFFVNNQYTFEIGGKKKGYGQIKNMPDSYIASDNIEIGFKNKIPLWLFGFLY
jgi:hypothetical protein